MHQNSGGTRGEDCLAALFSPAAALGLLEKGSADCPMRARTDSPRAARGASRRARAAHLGRLEELDDGLLPKSTPPESSDKLHRDNRLTGCRARREVFAPRLQLRRLDLSGNRVANGTSRHADVFWTQLGHINISGNGDISGEIPARRASC